MLFVQRRFQGRYCWVALAFALSLGQANGAEGGRSTPVVVEQAELRMLSPITWVAGSVVSRNEAQLAAEVTGRLLKVAEEGVTVVAGATVARIDDVLPKVDVTEAEAAVAREQANLTFLKREMERLQQLAQQNNAALAQLEKTSADHDIATSTLAAAAARLNLARERLARTVIKAPFAGVVATRLKRAGEWVAVGDAVVQLVATSDLEIEATAPLNLRSHLAAGQRLVLQSDNGNGVGRIRAVVPVADSRSRLLTLRIDVVEGAWVVGQPLRVALPSATPREVLSISRDALILRRGGASLFKVGDDNLAQPVAVETGMAVGDHIEVRGPLQAGDRVVVRGNERLRPGQAVDIKGEGKGGAVQ